MLELKRFDDMDEQEYEEIFDEIVESVKEWKRDFDDKKFRSATDNLRKQLIDNGMPKAEAQRLIWSGSVLQPIESNKTP